MNIQLSRFYWMQLFFRYIEKYKKNRKSSLRFGRKYTDRKYRKKDNKEETEIPQQNWETEVLIEPENVIGNQDDSEQTGPQKHTNVKDTNVCGEMLPKVLDFLSRVSTKYVQIQTRLHMPYIGRDVLSCDCAYAAPTTS